MCFKYDLCFGKNNCRKDQYPPNPSLGKCLFIFNISSHKKVTVNPILPSSTFKITDWVLSNHNEAEYLQILIFVIIKKYDGKFKSPGDL